MIGRIRLECPDQGVGLALWNGPLLAVSRNGGDRWELSVLFEGLEYFARATLDRDEIQALGRGFARTTPDRWRWIGLPTLGAPRFLPIAQRPPREALTRLASDFSLHSPLDPGTLPVLDRVEVWLCEISTGRPLARVRTAINRERAIALTYLGPYQIIEPWRQTPETWSFQRRLNARLNRSQEPGRYRFQARIYERTERGVFRLGRSGILGRVKTGILPEGPLAEPWESSRQALLARLDAREPGRQPIRRSQRVTGTVTRLGATQAVAHQA